MGRHIFAVIGLLKSGCFLNSGVPSGTTDAIAIPGVVTDGQRASGAGV